MKAILLILLLAVAISDPGIAQTVPSGMTFQGRLADTSGVNMADGTGYEIEVRLWSAPTGGTARTLTEAFANNGSVHLGLTVTKTAFGAAPSTIGEILPREQILSSPYALRAASVQADGVNSAAIHDGSVQNVDLAAALKAQLDQLVPSGSVMAFAGATAPAGWLKCDGSPVSRIQYAAHFAAIGTAHRSCDGSNTFHLPDYRCRFLRGVSESATSDPDATARTSMVPGDATGNTVGSVQADEIKSHTHVVQNGGVVSTLGVFAYGERGVVAGEPSNQTDFDGGSETCPKNAYVIYFIKA